ncbi:HK97 gp10 family phage protein [uncultured Acetobacterium sp.]|jgi:HK97 gp10 family phage protein|uniref:HK97 gp10 family phage protein n=1 Tax=uncultured Acetobacterium sp. TaxID=217139 RepID=UPI0025DFBE46|nr:HK97 gp10 family phage protein [uncultured Acetobacterium sp.]
MAKITIKMPDDFLLKISQLAEKSDEIIPKVLEAGGEVVLEKVKSNLSAVIGSETKLKSRSTGELEAALGVSPVKQDSVGNYNLKIGFSEPRSGGESNAKIGNILEYGKSGQLPKPFLKPAKAKSRKSCIEAMKNKLESEIDSL